MPVVPARLPAPTAVPDPVQAAFGARCTGPPLRPAGADSEHFPALDASGEAVLLRWDCYEGRPLTEVTRWCGALSDAGLSVPGPRPTHSGEMVVSDAGDWTCWPRIDGAHPAASPGQAARAGGAVGALHASGVLARLADAPSPSLLRWAGPLDAGDRRTLAMLLDGPPSLCHLDAHRANLLDDGERLWVIDWVDAGRGTVALEGAVGAAYWAADGGRGCGRAFADAFAAATGTEPDDVAVATALSLLHGRAARFGEAAAERFAHARTQWRRAA